MVERGSESRTSSGRRAAPEWLDCQTLRVTLRVVDFSRETLDSLDTCNHPDAG